MTRSVLAALAATGLLAACSSDDSTTPSPTASPSPSPTPAPTACETYCNSIAANCTAAADAPYSALTGTCLDVCNTRAFWPAAGANTNSLACRTTHAALAGSPGPASVHCPHAGPTGGSVCGTLCENYCYLAQKNCTGANALTFTPDCATACGNFATTGAANSSSGNTVQCRINHLVAAGGNPATHCPHGSVASTAGTCQ